MRLRWLVVGVAALAVLAGAAVAADRWALDAVEDQLTAAVTAQVDSATGGPDADITGFPFLTQLAAGSLDEVVLTAASATLGDMTLVDADVHARDVSTGAPYTARTAHLTASSVSLPDLELDDVVVRAAGVSTADPLTARTADVTAASARLAGVDLERVVVRAEGVTTGEPFTARTAELTGSLSTATLQGLVAERAGVEDVRLGVQDGRVTATTAVLGLDVEAEVVPRPQGRTIAVEVVSVSVGGATVDIADLPRRVRAQLSELTLPVDGLPEGVELTDVTVEAAGARITAAGSDVTLGGP